jgi:hypothetical protein
MDLHGIRYRSLYEKLSSKKEFRENRLSDIHTLLRGVKEFQRALSPCLCLFEVKFGTYLHIMLLGKCEFREMRCNESHALLQGVNEILHVSATFFIKSE